MILDGISRVLSRVSLSIKCDSLPFRFNEVRNVEEMERGMFSCSKEGNAM